MLTICVFFQRYISLCQLDIKLLICSLYLVSLTIVYMLGVFKSTWCLKFICVFIYRQFASAFIHKVICFNSCLICLFAVFIIVFILFCFLLTYGILSYFYCIFFHFELDLGHINQLYLHLHCQLYQIICNRLNFLKFKQSQFQYNNNFDQK